MIVAASCDISNATCDLTNVSWPGALLGIALIAAVAAVLIALIRKS